jgi:hypothetical protein
MVSTYYLTAKDHPKDRVEVEIGDSKQQDFFPQVKVLRWDNEVNLSVRLIHSEKDSTVTTEGETIKWIGTTVDAHFYSVNEGYEFEVILKEKPTTNTVSFSLNTKGLDFFYQPALTPEALETGHHRPEHVVGSYAIYASEEKKNYSGSKEYKVGKVGHIYRPLITDFKNSKVWGELNVSAGLLTITIPQAFLDSAVYPVIVDPTLGYTTEGASHVNIADNYVTASHETTDGTGGDSSVVHLAVAEGADGSRYLNFAIYDTSYNRLTSQTTLTPDNGVTGWITGSYVATLAASTKHWLAVTTSTNALGITYDSADSNRQFWKNINSLGWPNLAANVNPPDGNGTDRYSLYVDYGSASPPVAGQPSASIASIVASNPVLLGGIV